MDVQEVRKLDAYLKRLFGNPRIRVVPKKADSADVFVGEERIGGLAIDEDDDDDERSYNFEMKITLGDASTTEPDIKKLDAYLKRKFDNERVRVVPRVRKKDFGRSLCRRGIYRRAVLRREGPALLLFRAADPGARSRRAGPAQELARRA